MDCLEQKPAFPLAQQPGETLSLEGRAPPACQRRPKQSQAPRPAARRRRAAQKAPRSVRCGSGTSWKSRWDGGFGDCDKYLAILGWILLGFGVWLDFADAGHSGAHCGLRGSLS